MAANIYMTSGISGSGKSTFTRWLKRAVDAVEINADNIRAELGDVSDQSKNDEVWKRVGAETVKQVAGGNNVILSNTNLHYYLIKEQAEKFPLNKVILFIMDDSRNLQLCKDRVAKDLERGLERSKVPQEVIERQYRTFNYLLRDLSTKNDIPKNLKITVVDGTFDFKTIDDPKTLDGKIDKSVFKKSRAGDE